MNRLWVTQVPISVLAFLIFALGAATILAQGFDSSSTFPDVRVPEHSHFRAIVQAPIQSSRNFGHRRLTLNSVSIAALVAGEAVDSWGTYKNMTHVRWVCGNSPAFAGAYDTNAPGEISSLRDVQTVCGAGPAGQSPNWAFDTTRAGYFGEGGWVTQFHLAGDRNYVAVEAWNLVNDVGWELVARRLGRRSGWTGKWGPALNFARGIVHLDLGIENLVAVSHHQNPNKLDLYVPKNSNYTAPRWWGMN